MRSTTVGIGNTGRGTVLRSWAALLALLVGCSGGPATTGTAAQDGRAQDIQAGAPLQGSFAIRRGVNLTAWFQYGGFTPARLSELAQLKSMGADFVRLPIEPTRFYDPFSLDWKNLTTTLDEAGRVGLKVIVDLHPLYSTQRLALHGDARYQGLLTTLARRLPAWGLNNVALELMNEPISDQGNECDPAFDWNSWQARFHAAARAGSTDLTLILTGACWGGIDGLLKVKPISDPHVIYSIHDYDEMPFTHQSASWSGWTLAYSRGIPYPPTPANIRAALPDVLYHTPTARMREQIRSELEDYGRSGFNQAVMLARLQKAADWARTNKTRLLLGEFGVLKTAAPPQDRVAWIGDMRRSAEKLSIAHAMWDYNPEGSFSPFRGGRLEAGVVRALGLNPPPDAVPTPPNLAVTRTPTLNPVDSSLLTLADFEQGSVSNFGVPTGYYGYGKPDLPTYTSSPDDRVPVQGGHLQYDYDLPLNNDFAGVSALISYKSGAVLDTTPYTHLRLDLKVTGGSQVRVELAGAEPGTGRGAALDDGGDHPNVQLPTKGDWGWETYTVPLDSFVQSGWGKPVDVAKVLRQVQKVIVTPMTTGTAGTISIDNVALVRTGEAANPPPLSAARRPGRRGAELRWFGGQRHERLRL